MVSFFCSSSLAKMNLDVLVFIFLASSIFQDCLSQVPEIITYSSKSSEVLRCSISNQKTYASWTEEASNGSTLAVIYEYSRGSGITPTSPPTEGKYSNFVYNYNDGTNFDLVIENVNKDDGGKYNCIVIPGSDITAYQVKVEALPLNMTIICNNSATCDETNGMPDSSMECTCTASEVSPKGLQLEWSGASHTVGQFQETDAGDYFDLTSQATVNPTEASDEVTCSVTDYQSEEIKGSVNVTYKFAPPECTLLIDCSSAMVTCNCKGQSPPSMTYVFYDQSMQLIGTSNNNQMNVAAEPGNNTFSCRGCNGIFYGNSSLASNTTDCPTSTTTSPTTPTTETTTVTPPIDTTTNSTADYAPSTESPATTEQGNNGPDGDGGASTAAIVGGVVGGCVVVGGGVIIIILIVKKSGNGDGENNLALHGGNTNPSYTEPAYDEVEKDTQAKSTVTASTFETTNSAPPVYGVVNKSTKKKSDNTDGNGVNSKLQSEPDQVEYAAVNKPKPDPQPAPRSSKPPGNNTEPEKMELQYADIDHSNRGRSNEIHQPADAPTEYATVQSVIV